LVRDGVNAGNGRFFTRGGRIAVSLFVLVCVTLILLGMVIPRPLQVEYVEEWKFTLTGTDHIGGKYNATVEHYNVSKFNETFGRDEISYWFNGSNERGPFIPTAVNTMNWIRNNTANDSVFLSWWPYGHMIRGMAERESIISAPSMSIVATVFFPERVFGWENQEKVNDVAGALLATDLNVTADMMSRYGAGYILVEKDGITYIDALCKALGRDPEEFAVYEHGTGFRFVGEGSDCAMCRFITANELGGFEKTYEDAVFKIFKLRTG
jgi:hypothetical protein